jgi:hypothetical protein
MTRSVENVDTVRRLAGHRAAYEAAGCGRAKPFDAIPPAG